MKKIAVVLLCLVLWCAVLTVAYAEEVGEEIIPETVAVADEQQTVDEPSETQEFVEEDSEVQASETVPLLEEEVAEDEPTPTDWSSTLSFEELKAYAEEELIPIVVFCISAIGTIYVAISPVLHKIKKAGEGFKSATEDVNGVREESRQTNKDVKRLEEELQLALEKVKAHEAATDATMKRMEQMMLIGFGNQADLVRDGYARRIYEISEEGNTDKEHEEVKV